MTQPPAVAVPFYDLAAAHREIAPEIDAAIAECLAAGMFILGDGVAAFERAFADYCEAKHCVGVGNGLDALRLALETLGIGRGDEVIVPVNTFIATWLAVRQVGAVPVGVDADPATWGMDGGQLAAAVTARTRAIIPVHLYGAPADLTAVHAVAARHGLAVIEDAAQAHGARIGGRRIGGASTFTCWSFYPGKNLGALGDGGAVTTNDDALADRLRRLGNYGSAVKYVHDLPGCNSRLDELQARVLSVKLRHLDRWNAARRAVAEAYRHGLAGSGVETLPVLAGTQAVWHLFPALFADRDRAADGLRAQGIVTLTHYPIPPHRQGAFADLNIPEGRFPVAERIHRQELSLPIGPHQTPEQTAAVIAAVRALGFSQSEPQ